MYVIAAMFIGKKIFYSNSQFYVTMLGSLNIINIFKKKNSKNHEMHTNLSITL